MGWYWPFWLPSSASLSLLLSRHTGAALGLVIGYLVLSVVLGVATIAVPALGFLPRWLPEYNVTAFLEYGTSYHRGIEETTASGAEYRSIEERISFTQSAGYWAVLATVAVAGSALRLPAPRHHLIWPPSRPGAPSRLSR